MLALHCTADWESQGLQLFWTDCQTSLDPVWGWQLLCRDRSQTGEHKLPSDILKDVEQTDLINYGLIPEFVGRFPVVCSLQARESHAAGTSHTLGNICLRSCLLHGRYHALAMPKALFRPERLPVHASQSDAAVLWGCRC